MEHIAYTLPANVSGKLAITLPWSFTASGLPVGVQVTGRRHGDLGLLRVARARERPRWPLRSRPLD